MGPYSAARPRYLFQPEYPPGTQGRQGGCKQCKQSVLNSNECHITPSYCAMIKDLAKRCQTAILLLPLGVDQQASAPSKYFQPMGLTQSHLVVLGLMVKYFILSSFQPQNPFTSKQSIHPVRTGTSKSVNMLNPVLCQPQIVPILSETLSRKCSKISQTD